MFVHSFGSKLCTNVLSHKCSSHLQHLSRKMLLVNQKFQIKIFTWLAALLVVLQKTAVQNSSINSFPSLMMCYYENGKIDVMLLLHISQSIQTSKTPNRNIIWFESLLLLVAQKNPKESEPLDRVPRLPPRIYSNIRSKLLAQNLRG